MTPEQFCYWLQGRAELQPDSVPSEAEWKMIREHLATVFNKVTPPLQTIPYMPAPDTASNPSPSWLRWRTECKATSPQLSTATC